MATRRTRTSKSLTAKSMELALAVPQVFAHRVTRMALAGPKLSDRDRKEFQIMVTEKQAVFAQAWTDMAVHAFLAHQAFTVSMLRFFLTPFSYQKPSRHWPRRRFRMRPLACWVKASHLFTAKRFRMPGGLLKLDFAKRLRPVS